MANAPIKSRRPVISKSPRKKIKTITVRPAPSSRQPMPDRIAAQRSFAGTGDMISARPLCSRSPTETICTPFARIPSMIMGSARTVSRRSPPPSCKRMMFPHLRSPGAQGGRCAVMKLAICPALDSPRQSLGSIASPMVRYPMFSEISRGRTSSSVSGSASVE